MRILRVELQMKVLVIIPAYNEAGNIARVLTALRQRAPEFDCVVVDDGSSDDTAAICRGQGCRVLTLAVNLGIGGAMQTVQPYAAQNGYNAPVHVDGEGKHDPAYLAAMLEALTARDADMVIGSRFLEGEGYQSTRLRRWGIRYFSFLIRLLTGKTVTDPTSGYRMVQKELIETFAADYPPDYPEPESVVSVLRHGRKVVEIPVQMRARTGGSSSISAYASLYYTIKVSLAILLEELRKN